MNLKHEPIMLEELAGGAAIEHFDAGVRQILRDIDDAAKKTDAPRSFALKFSFAPDEKGYSTKITVELQAVKLAPSRPAMTSAFLSHEHGQLECLEVQQVEMPIPDNVRKMEAE